MKKLTILLALVVGACSQSISVSKQSKINVFGGITEQYNPVIVRSNFKLGDYQITPFIGGDKNLEIGLDIGKRYGKDLYFSWGLGAVNNSKKFEGQEYRNNFHLDLSIGYETDKDFIGLAYTHSSRGTSVDLIPGEEKKNNGINNVGIRIGRKF